MFVKSLVLGFAMASALPLHLTADQSTSGFEQTSLGHLQNSTSVSKFGAGIAQTRHSTDSVEEVNIVGNAGQSDDLVAGLAPVGQGLDAEKEGVMKSVEARGHYLVIIHPGEPLPPVLIVSFVLGGILVLGAIASLVLFCIDDHKRSRNTSEIAKARSENAARIARLFLTPTTKNEEPGIINSDVESQMRGINATQAQHSSVDTQKAVEAQSVVTPPVDCHLTTKSNPNSGKPISSLPKVTVSNL